jgi:hypothetical protein
VWAVDAVTAPSYWFPRDCPRVLAWVTETTTDEDRERIIGPGGGARVHAIEHAWAGAMSTVRLYAYRLPAATFRPLGEPVPHAMVSRVAVEPLGPPVSVGDLLALHATEAIQVRLLAELEGFWAAVRASSLGFSGIRLHNAGALRP